MSPASNFGHKMLHMLMVLRISDDNASSVLFYSSK